MSLADIVQIALTTKIERRRLAPGEAQSNWQKRNRAHVNAYRREWRKRRKAA